MMGRPSLAIVRFLLWMAVILAHVSASICNSGMCIANLTNGADSDHNCAILSDGNMLCWGRGGLGRLGNGGTANVGDGANEMGNNIIPAVKPTNNLIVSACTGSAFTCALFQQGTIACTGSNFGNGIGYNDTATRLNLMTDITFPAPFQPAMSIACGSQHMVALTASLHVVTWGSNQGNQLGYGEDASTLQCIGCSTATSGLLRSMEQAKAVDLGTVPAVQTIAAGRIMSCAMFVDGRVKCWGENQSGSLGVNTAISCYGISPATLGDNLPFLQMPFSGPVSRLSLGRQAQCALYNQSNALCWGTFSGGALGRGTTTDLGTNTNPITNTTSPITFPPTFVPMDVCAGYGFACALGTANQTQGIVCWGAFNSFGQLGRGTTSSVGNGGSEPSVASLGFVSLGSGMHPVAMSCGFEHVCALMNNTNLRCWGRNSAGQLGINSTTTIGDAPNEMGNLMANTVLYGFCSRCSPGKYIPARACLYCPAIAAANANDAGCSDCPSGTFSSMYGATSDTQCTPCPANTFAASGSAVCTPCPAGTFFNGTGGTNPFICTECAAGSFNPTPGHDCMACGVNTYQNLTGQASCVNCSTGTFNPNTGSNSSADCRACTVDVAANVTNSTSITLTWSDMEEPGCGSLESYLVAGAPVCTGNVIVYETVVGNVYAVDHLEANVEYALQVIPVYADGLGTGTSVNACTGVCPLACPALLSP
jgi:alpha-tubulin suppressor-like RCC1 family protein